SRNQGSCIFAVLPDEMWIYGYLTRLTRWMTSATPLDGAAPAGDDLETRPVGRTGRVKIHHPDRRTRTHVHCDHTGRGWAGRPAPHGTARRAVAVPDASHERLAARTRRRGRRRRGGVLGSLARGERPAPPGGTRFSPLAGVGADRIWQQFPGERRAAETGQGG